MRKKNRLVKNQILFGFTVTKAQVFHALEAKDPSTYIFLKIVYRPEK